MKKLCMLQSLSRIVCAGVLAGGLLSCVSTNVPAENGTERAETAAEAAPVLPAEAAPVSSASETAPAAADDEVFSPVNFAGNLQSVLESGSLAEALALFDSLPPEYENDASLQYLHASLLISNGELDKAADITDTLLKKNPDDTDVLLLSAMLAKASGDTAKKSTALKRILSLDPTNSDANVELGEEQMLRRNYNQAKRYYLKGLAGDPGHEGALFGYGQVSYYTGDDEASRSSFEKILESDPENSLAYAYLGKLAAEKENYKVATEYIEKALKFDDDIYDYWLDYGQYLRYQGDFAGAESAWRRAAELESDYFLAYAYLAGLFDEENRFDEALAMYRKVIELNPKYYFAYESLGMFAWHENDFAEVRRAFALARSMNEENVSYPLMIAAAYLKEGKTKESRELLGKAMRNKSQTSVEYAVLRLYYDQIGDQQVVQKVLNESNRNLKGKMLYYLGLFYDINGNDVLAEKYYTDVLNLNSPMFFEYRLAEWAVSAPDAPDGARAVSGISPEN